MTFVEFIVKSDLTCKKTKTKIKTKMDGFILVCPNRKQTSCLENLRKFSVKELSGMLKYCNENISGKRENLLMGTFTTF